MIERLELPSWIQSLLEKPEIALDQLKEVPHHQRRQIVSGMRWTVWLSAVSIPFSYGTTVLLARTSPEAIGTYGLLSVYIGAVLGLFYLGGDAVAIKFIPELDPERRLSFLVSYFTIVCLAVLRFRSDRSSLPRPTEITSLVLGIYTIMIILKRLTLPRSHALILAYPAPLTRAKALPQSGIASATSRNAHKPLTRDIYGHLIEHT